MMWQFRPNSFLKYHFAPPPTPIGEGLELGISFWHTYLSNPGITSVMPWAVGCLTRENTQECRAFFAQCRALFVDFFHF
jgi:hypothetical protein